jgi:SAM-dependent methyltransferase
MSLTNAEQVAYWNGPMGERWTRQQAAIDRAFAAFTARLLEVASPRPAERVLDVGCGCGVTTLAAADAVGPAGAVLGVDISAPMLARARERALGRRNVELLEDDASTHAFEPSFDVVLSRFGVMFFRDPTAAFANLRTALRPGGRVAVIVWRPMAENEWAELPREAAIRHVPAEAPLGPDEPGPFSFGDAARIERVLGGAGFTDLVITRFDAEVLFSTEGVDDAVAFAMNAGPTARLLRDAGDDLRERVRGEVEKTLRPRLEGTRLTLGGSTWLVQARR